jgi:hypothetical protein
VIKLLFKKGDRADLRNWRPLSMLCCDYKLLSAVFTARLGSVAAKLIYPEQTGFVRGRNIGENILLMQSVLDLEGIEGCVILTDQEKAYDRVSWEFRDLALKAYGFGPFFRGAIKCLYKNSCAKVFINGYLSNSFSLSRSVRQGDPLSPLLYNLLDNFLAAALLRDPSFSGVAVRGLEPHPKVCISQFADDKAFFCGSATDVSRLCDWLEVYARATGARIHWGKSQGVWLGAPFAVPPAMARLPWAAPSDAITYLGVPVSATAPLETAWEAVVGKFEATLAAWRHRGLSSWGRLTVLRSLATSRLWHVASVTPLPPDLLTRIERACFLFFWAGKRAGAVRRSVAKQPVDRGGLGMFSLPAFVSALHVRWLFRLLSPGVAAWKTVVWAAIAAAAPSWCRARPWDLLQSNVDPTRIVFSGPPSIWEGAFRTWRKLSGGPSPTMKGDVLSVNQWLGQPIFHNPFLLSATSGSSFNFAASWGAVSVVGDLVDRVSFKRVSWREEGIPRFMEDEWWGGIPEPVRARLRLHDTHFAGRAFRFVRPEVRFRPALWPHWQPFTLARVPETYRVGDGAVRLELLEVGHDGQVVPTGRWSSPQVPAVLDAHDLEARVARVGQRSLFDGFVQQRPFGAAHLGLRAGKLGSDGKPVWTPIDLLTSANVRRALDLAEQQPVIAPVRWSERLAPETVDWRAVWLWARSARHRSRIQADLLYRMLHNALATGHRNRWRTGATGKCSFGCDAVEDAIHLFYDCLVSRRAWEVALEKWRAICGERWQLSPRLVVTGRPPDFDADQSFDLRLLPRFDSLHACTIQAVWNLRCRVAIDGAAVPSAPTFSAFIDDLLLKLNLR